LDNAGRERLKRVLAGWIALKKYGERGNDVLIALDQYRIAECLGADPAWQLPE